MESKVKEFKSKLADLMDEYNIEFYAIHNYDSDPEIDMYVNNVDEKGKVIALECECLGSYINAEKLR